jgi:hypothetical protein
MSGRSVKSAVRILLALSVAYLVYSCYSDEQDIRVDPVTQPKQWTYDITSIPFGERMYYVLIDGELNSDAALELQTQRTTSHLDKPDTTFIDSSTSKLPRGKFSMYYDRDDSGPEEFTYYPLKATKGWVRVQIIPGQWNWRDSSRTPLLSQSRRTYPISIKNRVSRKSVFHP